MDADPQKRHSGGMAAAPTSTPAGVDPVDTGDLSAYGPRLDPSAVSGSLARPESSLRSMLCEAGEPTAIGEQAADL